MLYCSASIELLCRDWGSSSSHLYPKGYRQQSFGFWWWMRLFKHLNLLVICGAIFGGSIPLAMAIPSSELRPQDNQFFLGLHGNHYFNNSNTLADKKSGNIGAKASLRLVSKKNSTFRAALEGEGNAAKAEAVNDGIVYLMLIPYILVALIGFAVYRIYRKKKA